jgi:hypothetical protein
MAESDESRRSFTKKVALLLAGGIGGYAGQDWYRERDDRIDTAARANAIEDDIASANWIATQVDQENVSASFEREKEYSAGGTVYEVNVEVPLADHSTLDPFCDDAGDEQEVAELASMLEEDAENVYEKVYDNTGLINEPFQEEHEDQVSTYTVRFVDESGYASFSFSGDQAKEIAGGDNGIFDTGFMGDGDEYRSDNDSVEQRFKRMFREAFEVGCR